MKAQQSMFFKRKSFFVYSFDSQIRKKKKDSENWTENNYEATYFFPRNLEQKKSLK